MLVPEFWFYVTEGIDMCRIDIERVVHRFEIGAPGADAMGERARKLIAAGASPFDRLEGYRGEMLCLFGTVWRLARMTVRENAKVGPVLVKWKPYERFAD